MDLRDRVKIFKALADETRLRMITLLSQRECCVCEVMQVLDISQTRASRNLSQLYNAGFLILRKEGLWSLYSVDRQKVEPFLSQLLGALVDHLENDPQVKTDVRNLEKAERVGPNSCCQPLASELEKAGMQR